MDRYDELPYDSFPIEWTAPERLALASMLHGGPRPPRRGYRVLELGSSNGANLLPMAWYRRHATFVGLDRAPGRVALAQQRAESLGLCNASFVCADLSDAEERLEGRFDFIIAHGVLSWIRAEAREAMLALCARRLRPGGLLYFNYNAKPGWVVRGMVRDFLLAHLRGVEGVRARADAARAVSITLARSMAEDEHPWSLLMANEFRFVSECRPSLIAHDILCPHNDAFWHREVAAMTEAHGLRAVADADFSYPAIFGDGRAREWLEGAGIEGIGVDDTADLLQYRQLRAPILTLEPWETRPPELDELSGLALASRLELRDPGGPEQPAKFEHPNGYEVEVGDEGLRDVLRDLQPRWPRGRLIVEMFEDPAEVMDDLRLLHRSGLVALRLDASLGEVDGVTLNRHEAEWGAYRTSADHRTEPV